MKIASINNYVRFRSSASPFATAQDPIEPKPQKAAAEVLEYPQTSDPVSYLRDTVKQGYYRDRRLHDTRTMLLSKTSVPYYEWLGQFDTAKERNLALKMLQHYVYIDIDNARKAFKKLHSDLEKEIDMDKTKFATLGSAKSGSMMGYFYRQANKMRSKGNVCHEFSDRNHLPKEEQFLTHTELNNPEFNRGVAQRGFENLVIVDDIIGDGDSLTEYFNKDVLESLAQYKNIYYVTLVKDPDGEKRVREKFPDLNIQFRCAQEVHKYDSEENTDFTPEEKQEITELLNKYGNKIAPELVDKYSRSKLLISFDWNTPGNTPMIFNYDTPEWKALFRRYNGLELNNVKPNFDFKC